MRRPAVHFDHIGLTAEQLKKARFAPRVKAMRRALCLTQEAFAARCAIPLGTIRGWEQGVTEPDATAKAYLRASAGDAEGVARALTVDQAVGWRFSLSIMLAGPKQA